MPKRRLTLVVNSINAAARTLSRKKVKSVQFTLSAPANRQAAQDRCAWNEASDADRVLLARKSRDGRTMIGPDEVVPCDRHEGRSAIHRWTWPAPDDGDHIAALEGAGESQITHNCPDCEEEADERYREEIGER